jgi:ADP-heptose:LPS heptosyltransferase
VPSPPPNKILVISLAGIGDTLFATPLIRELRARFPGATIDAFVLWKGSADVLRGNPHLNSIMQQDLIRQGRWQTLRYLRSLRDRGYDISINTFPQSRIEYRLVARIIGARRRLSHDYGHWAGLDRCLVTHRIAPDYNRHCVENNLALAEFLGLGGASHVRNCELHLSPADHAWAESFVQEKSLAGHPLLGIHVGSGGTKNLALRRWPLGHFAGLIQRLGRERPELRVLLFGGPEESAAHDYLMSAGLGPNLLRSTGGNLREAAALMGRCHGFLSVDTALMHVAATMGVPHQLVIETPTWNKTVAPFGNPFTLVPNPAVHGRNLEYYRYDGKGIRGSEDELRRIMEAVTVDDVFTAVTETLDGK